MLKHGYLKKVSKYQHQVFANNDNVFSICPSLSDRIWLNLNVRKAGNDAKLFPSSGFKVKKQACFENVPPHLCYGCESSMTDVTR